MKATPGEYPLVVTAADFLSSDGYQFEGEAACVPLVSSTGHGHASLKRVHYVSGKFAVANIITALQKRNDAPVDMRFLWLLLDHGRDEIIVPLMKGTANVSLSQGALAAAQVALPPLDEQRRIVDLIGGLDDTITASERQTTASEHASTQVRRQAFEAASSNHSSAAAGEIFDMLLGRQKSARQTVGDHVIPYLRAANISSHGFMLDDVLTMNFSPAEQSKFGLLPRDVMLVEGGSLGQSSMWFGEIDGVVGFDKHVIRLREVPGRSTADYALQWTRWAYESGAFDTQATGATIRALGFGRAKAMPVPRLTVEQQDSLVEPLRAADDVVRRSRELTNGLRGLRSNLLTALLSGEHEIPVSYDEVMEATA